MVSIWLILSFSEIHAWCIWPCHWLSHCLLLVTVIFFALKFTFLSLSVKAFYSRTVATSPTLSPASSQSHSHSDPTTSNFWFFPDTRTPSYLLTQGHSPLCRNFPLFRLCPKTLSILTILEDFLTPPGRGKALSCWFLKHRAPFSSQFTNICWRPSINSALCYHNPYTYIYYSKCHAGYHYFFTCLEGTAWRQPAMWIVWLRQWHCFLFLQTHPATVTSAFCLWAQPRTPESLGSSLREP